MRNRVVGTILTLAIVALCVTSESIAQGRSPVARSQGGIVLAVTGAATGGTFSGGLFALQRFEAGSNGGIEAVGVITGTVVVAGAAPRTFAAPARFPVMSINGVVPGSPTSFAPVPSGTRAVWDHEAPTPAAGIVLVQAPPQEDCGVLSIMLGAINIDLLGLVVNLDPIALEISGEGSGPLGALICGVLNVLTSAIGTVVNLLNAILGLLGGLTGGLGA